MSQRGRSLTRTGSSRVRWADEEQARQLSLGLAKLASCHFSTSESSKVAYQGSVVSSDGVLPFEIPTLDSLSLSLGVREAQGRNGMDLGSGESRDAPRRNGIDLGSGESRDAVPRDEGPEATEPQTEEPQADDPNAGEASPRESTVSGRINLRDLENLDWHLLSVNEVAKILRTSTSYGLFKDQAAGRYQQFGKNASLPPKTNRIPRVLGYFFKGFGTVLFLCCVAAFLSWRLGKPRTRANLALASVLTVIFLLLAAFAMYQDWSTFKIKSTIKGMLPQTCEVTRSGNSMLISASGLVPGDLITIRDGENLPADLRFISVSSNARFDRSSLTGESVPFAASVNVTDSNYLETRNIGLQGTRCLVGTCTGLVVATGDRTVFGRITAFTNESKARKTPLEKDVERFVRIFYYLVVFAIAVMVWLWLAYLRKDYPYWITLPNFIVYYAMAAVALIPEGLPIAIMVGLAIFARRMKEAGILCKSLAAVETLGSVSVLCSDKTGTLTEGKMTVVSCCFGDRIMTVKQAQWRQIQYMDTGNVSNVTSALSQIGAISALCNASEIERTSDAYVPPSEMKILGDATDIAILRFSEELKSGNVAYYRSCWQKVYELAFQGANKFMICCFSSSRPEAVKETIPREAAEAFGPKDLFLTIKGAPDVLMSRCSHYLTEWGVVAPLDADAISALEARIDMCSSKGQRCLILAQKTVHQESLENAGGPSKFDLAMKREAEEGLLLTGLVSIVDPLRPEIRETVSVLRRAGIKVAMVTGDSALTALAIARDAGIVTSFGLDNTAHLRRTPRLMNLLESEDSSAFAKEAVVISGPELQTLSNGQLMELLLYEEIIFARTTPGQKLRIVEMFQTSAIVAMVGDGINDAPSLKAANIGISVGTACDGALEAADMVLSDGFPYIVAALAYGRVVFDHMRKTVVYVLPASSFAQFWPFFLAFLLGFPQLFSPFLMLLVSCFTDCFAAVALWGERGEADVLRRQPRDVKKDRLINLRIFWHSWGFVGVMETVAAMAMSFLYLKKNGYPAKMLWLSYGILPGSIDLVHYEKAMSTAFSIYFVSIVVMQWFHLMATRTRYLSIFQHPPLFYSYTQNWKLFAAILIAFVTTIFFIYCPPLQRGIHTSGVPVEYWFLPLAFGLFIMFVDEMRRFCIRRWPQGWIAWISW